MAINNLNSFVSTIKKKKYVTHNNIKITIYFVSLMKQTSWTVEEKDEENNERKKKRKAGLF